MRLTIAGLLFSAALLLPGQSLNQSTLNQSTLNQSTLADLVLTGSLFPSGFAEVTAQRRLPGGDLVAVATGWENQLLSFGFVIPRWGGYGRWDASGRAKYVRNLDFGGGTFR